MPFEIYSPAEEDIDEAQIELDRKNQEFLEKIASLGVQLGSGRAADVFAMPESSVCLKRTGPKNLNYATNSAAEEVSLMTAATKITSLRVPKPVLSIELEDGGLILMEKIDGFSLRDFYEQEMALPKAFNFDLFWAKIEQGIVDLNNSGLHHRDLHEGNIMIEEETGEPVVIDFGLSCVSFAEEDDPYRVYNFPQPGQTTVYLKDRVQISQLRQKMASYLQNHKYSI